MRYSLHAPAESIIIAEQSVDAHEQLTLVSHITQPTDAREVGVADVIVASEHVITRALQVAMVS